MNHVIGLTLAGVLASVLVGCASPSGPDANVLVPGPGEGLIVGSMGYELPDEPGGNPIGMGMATGVMTLDLERVGASGSAPCHIAITPLASESSRFLRMTTTTARVLFMRALPAGDYVIARRTSSLYMLHSQYSVADEGSGGAGVLHVSPGTITYVGGNVMKVSTDRVLFGQFSAPRAATFSQRDDAEVDMRHLRHVRPDLRAMPVDDPLVHHRSADVGTNGEAR